MSEKGQVSDGYHTFDELYDHRCHLFIALMRSNPGLSWRSKLHSDGTGYPSWFIAGMRLVSGDITYHLPLWMWSMLDGITTHDRAPEWDGHTAADVLKRLREWNERSASNGE
jgi:hypothetical protein